MNTEIVNLNLGAEETLLNGAPIVEAKELFLKNFEAFVEKKANDLAFQLTCLRNTFDNLRELWLTDKISTFEELSTKLAVLCERCEGHFKLHLTEYSERLSKHLLMDHEVFVELSGKKINKEGNAAKLSQQILTNLENFLRELKALITTIEGHIEHGNME